MFIIYDNRQLTVEPLPPS